MWVVSHFIYNFRSLSSFPLSNFPKKPDIAASLISHSLALPGDKSTLPPGLSSLRRQFSRADHSPPLRGFFSSHLLLSRLDSFAVGTRLSSLGVESTTPLLFSLLLDLVIQQRSPERRNVVRFDPIPRVFCMLILIEFLVFILICVERLSFGF